MQVNLFLFIKCLIHTHKIVIRQCAFQNCRDGNDGIDRDGIGLVIKWQLISF